MNLGTFLMKYMQYPHEFKFFPDTNGTPYGLAAIVFYVHNTEISIAVNGRAINKYDLRGMNPLQCTHMDICIVREQAMYSRGTVDLIELHKLVQQFTNEMSDDEIYKLSAPVMGYDESDEE